MRSINVDEAINLDINATQGIDFNLKLAFPSPIDGTVSLAIAGQGVTIAWSGWVDESGTKITFGARYGQMNFPTGIYTYAISLTKNDSKVNLFYGKFIFKPSL